MNEREARKQGASFSDAASYDALADLFLTERPRAIAYGAEIPTEPITDEARELEHGASDSPHAPPGAKGGINEVNEPTETDARGESRRNGRGERSAADVEVVVAGHLPILGGPWLAQYADRLAEHAGPVAFVQVRQGAVSLEIFHPPVAADEAQRLRAARIEAESFEDALLHAAARARHWLLRCDDDRVADLLAVVGVRCVTLVSAVDEAAVVASYRSLKELASALRERSAAPPRWRFVAAGTEAGAAVPGYARLATSAQRFLGLEVEQGPVVDRMRPMTVEQIGRWETALAPAQALAMIEAARQMHEEEQSDAGLAPAADSPTARRSAARAGLTADELSFLDELNLDEMDRAAAVHSAPQPQPAPQPATEAPARPVAVGDAPPNSAPSLRLEGQRQPTAPQPAARSERAAAARAAAPAQPQSPADSSGREPIDTLGLAEELGLTPLVARCPRAGSIQLAVDDAGRLHALAQQEPEVLALLLCASAWAVEHAALLSQAQPGVDIDAATEPILHLFTSAAPKVRLLLDSKLRLHLLLRPPCERRAGGFVCADLN